VADAAASPLGYRAAWPNEGIGGRNAFAQLGIMLSATDSVVVGTGIANIWARHPATMQAGGRTIADGYPDRFVLGVGVSHAPLVEPLTGQPFGLPIERMRTYLEQMDAEAGETPRDFPLIVAALGPRMLELARDHADGALPHAMPVAYFDEAGDVDRARASARTSGLFKIPGSPYTANYRRLGYRETDLADGPSDRLLSDVFALGGPNEIAARVGEHLAAGADHILLQLMAADVETMADGLERIAPALSTS
jgi:alkanesulfonate monooxygenase SsuD/methylene tetrahydromethanopterin reductase-like flavin-dependent oxidoreductase (luciferase family)